MTAEAIFKMNDGIETALSGHLSRSIIQLQNTLDTVFGRNTSVFFGTTELVQLARIFDEARQISYKMQTGVVSCRLFVTLAKSQTTTENIFGTFAFGLDKVSNIGRKILSKARAITKEEIQEFLDSNQ